MRREGCAEVGHAVTTWHEPGEDAGVRGVCYRAGCKSIREANSIIRQTIECRGLNSVVAVAVDMVCAECIDGN